MQCNTNRMLLTVLGIMRFCHLFPKLNFQISLFMQTQSQMGEGANHLENNVKAVFIFKESNQHAHSSSTTPKGLFRDTMYRYADFTRVLESHTTGTQQNVILTYK